MPCHVGCQRARVTRSAMVTLLPPSRFFTMAFHGMDGAARARDITLSLRCCCRCAHGARARRARYYCCRRWRWMTMTMTLLLRDLFHATPIIFVIVDATFSRRCRRYRKRCQKRFSHDAAPPQFSFVDILPFSFSFSRLRRPRHHHMPVTAFSHL